MNKLERLCLGVAYHLVSTENLREMKGDLEEGLQWPSEEATAEQIAEAKRELGKINKVLAKRRV